ncbi:hypothetical protein PTKIN_Ptkin08bG0090100 [Pterospermum kingtungense]
MECLSVGKRGGLALLWNKDVDLRISSYSNNHVDVVIHNQDDGSKWRNTGVYGVPETARRQVTWSLLRTLAEENNLPWLCMLDFKEILSQDEKMGGASRPVRQMGEGSDMVLERLDRWLATEGWL